MKSLVFASANAHKVEEIAAKLGGHLQLLGLADIGCTEDIAETATTLEGNAQIKARYVHNKYHVNCFADDTGLEVAALNNAPGVYSARYAGEQRSAQDNMALLMANMQGVNDRSARFRTVICLIIDGIEYLFEGIANGKIALEPSGIQGFGYDPVFVPDGYSKSFAEMSLVEKNEISHRGKAIGLLKDFLSKQNEE
jgi:XTP/dITP diphosphohydrolase